MKPLLIFHNHLHDTHKLIEGRLVLIDSDSSKVINTYIATSGLPGYQNADETNQIARGSIPETIRIGQSYWVDTSPLPMPNVKGVEGDFYQINPPTVIVDGVKRGDFGIHADANVPGSSGCVVLTSARGWNAFQTDIKNVFQSGIEKILLVVSYSK
jgi:hypothetical protein